MKWVGNVSHLGVADLEIGVGCCLEAASCAGRPIKAVSGFKRLVVDRIRTTNGVGRPLRSRDSIGFHGTRGRKGHRDSESDTTKLEGIGFGLCSLG